MEEPPATTDPDVPKHWYPKIHRVNENQNENENEN
jgi:hypothetical protein